MHFERNKIINFCSSTISINEIPCIFRDGFFKDFNKLKGKDRAVVTKSLPYLYRIWYFSTLMEGTSYSPANFINSQVSKSFCEDARVIPVITPIFKYRVLKDMKFTFKLFNIESHPVLADLEFFLEACCPDIGITEYGLLLDEEVNKIIDELTFKEEFYITFLTNIAFELKLLKDLPSINTYRAVPVEENIQNFFKLSKLDQLKRINESVIRMASKLITEVFDIDKQAFSEQGLTKLFKSAHDLDDFIDKLFKRLNMDLDNIDFERLLISAFNSEEPLDVASSTVDAMTLMIELSFLIDAYLLTPLGYYLQLVQPIYNEKMNFPFSFDQLIDAQKSDLPLMKFYFSMSNSFDLTTLGRKVLLDEKKPDKEFQNTKHKANYRKIFEDIRNHYYVKPSPIYDFGNVSFSADEHSRLWQEIDDFVNPKRRKSR
jgi:hypothetical protein